MSIIGNHSACNDSDFSRLRSPFQSSVIPILTSIMFTTEHISRAKLLFTLENI